jgi:hypothetical protein
VGARRRAASLVAVAVLAASGAVVAVPSTARAEPPAASDATSSLAAPPSFLELADRLRVAGSFSECAVEALRYASDHPDDRETGFDHAALCLSLAGRYLDARRVMLALPGQGGALTGVGRLRVCLTEVFLSRDAVEPACADLIAAGSGSHDGLLSRARHTLAMREIHAARWEAGRAALRDEAAATLETRDAVLSRWRDQDAAWLRARDALPRKSPALAAGLSALVPGLGRVYVGRWQDGIFSFLLVGLASGLAAQGFHEDGTSSVRGWILGSTAALLYAGNVYGSAVGAIVQRREAEAALDRQVDDDYRRRLEP